MNRDGSRFGVYMFNASLFFFMFCLNFMEFFDTGPLRTFNPVLTLLAYGGTVFYIYKGVSEKRKKGD